MEGKKSFVLYTDLIHTVRKLPKEKRADLFMMILEYVNDENPTTDDLLVEIAFEPIKRQLKRDLVKYNERAKRARENGSKGGRPPKEDETEKPRKPSGLPENPEEPKKPVNVSVNVNDNVNAINKSVNREKKPSPFENTDSELVTNATKAVAGFFDLNELNHPTHYMKIGNFIRFLEQQNKLDYFRNQFKGYKSVKSKNPKYIHSWQNYIGDAEKSYEDGAWNEKNWVKESIKEKEGEMVKSSISLTERLKMTNQLLKEEAEFFAKNKAELIAKNK